jgi:hypothetical protein
VDQNPYEAPQTKTAAKNERRKQPLFAAVVWAVFGVATIAFVLLYVVRWLL